MIECEFGQFDGWDDAFNLRPKGFTALPASLKLTTDPIACEALWLAAYDDGYSRGTIDKCSIVSDYVEVASPDELEFCGLEAPPPPPPPPPPPEPEPAGGLLVAVLPFLFLGNPSYSCSIIGDTFVGCDTFSLDWPDYSCSIIGDTFVSCDTFSLGWPDYSCSIIGDTFVSCDTFSLDWPDYSCTVTGDFVSCTTFSLDFPDFSCSRASSSFNCG